MSVSKYDTDVDPASNTSHALMLRLVGGNKKVLDVGCATGYLARALRENGCTVSGVEFDAGAAAEAAPALDKVVVGDLERLDLTEAFAGEEFDVIVFGDVLEHLRDPLPVLRSVKTLLAPGGSVVISVPNIAHGDVRLALLQGRFRYRTLGLLDNTHTHFFTRSTLREFLRDAGFTAVDVQRTTADLLTTEVADDARGADPRVIEDLRSDPDAMTYQFVVRAAPEDAVQLAADAAWRVAELERLVAVTDEEAAALRAEVDRLSRELAATQESAGRQTQALGAEVAAVAQREAAAREELAALHRTKVMRSARLPRKAWSRVRGLR